jgi:hypothetical protein
MAMKLVGFNQLSYISLHSPKNDWTLRSSETQSQGSRDMYQWSIFNIQKGLLKFEF